MAHFEYDSATGSIKAVIKDTDQLSPTFVSAWSALKSAEAHEKIARDVKLLRVALATKA